MNQTTHDVQKNNRLAPLLMVLIFLLCVLIILLQTFYPTPLAPNQATLDSLTHEIDPTRTSHYETLISTTSDSTTPSMPAHMPTFLTTVAEPNFCHNGPSKSYLGAIPLSAETQVEILAISDSGDWFMIRGENIDPCWVEASILNLTTNIPLYELQVFTTITTFEETACRIYPNPEREIQTLIPKSRRLVAYGKSNPNAEWILVVPHNSTKPCWIENRYSTDFPSLPYEAPDFALEPTATFTSSPTIIPTDTRRPIILMPTNTRRSGGGGNDNNPPLPTATSLPPTNTSLPPTNTPVPPPTNTPPPPPTPTLCWPPGHCK